MDVVDSTASVDVVCFSVLVDVVGSLKVDVVDFSVLVDVVGSLKLKASVGPKPPS